VQGIRDAAATAFQEVLSLAQMGDRQVQVAAALFGLAQVNDNVAAAHQEAAASLVIYRRLNHFKAEQVAGWITHLPISG
jgi:hypothetical protein